MKYKKIFCFVLFVSLWTTSFALAQDLKAWQIYNKEKQTISFQEMINQLEQADVVLFGEWHNNTILHWLQLRTTKALYERLGKRLLLGAEMLERDNQRAVQDFLIKNYDQASQKTKSKEANDSKLDVDALRYQALEKEARLWPNFKTDYFPLLDFARLNGLDFIATNVPRRYAQMVAKGSLDTLKSLPKAAKKWMVSLPLKVDMETPGYSEMSEMMGMHTGNKIKNFIAAQALKDATMAESIYKAKKKNRLLLHFNGDYHSKAYGGIYWYLKNYAPNWNIKVISIIESEQADLALPEKLIPTDIIIVVPKDMNKGY